MLEALCLKYIIPQASQPATGGFGIEIKSIMAFKILSKDEEY